MDGKMRALTVRQPWAGAIFELGKDVENRSWTTPYRGPILIHSAGAMWGTNKTLTKPLNDQSLAWSIGSIIGVVELVDVVRGAASVWADSKSWHWVLGDPQLFSIAIPARGAMGLWETPVELTKQVCDLL